MVDEDEQLVRIHGKLDKITEVLSFTASGLDALKQDHERLHLKVERHCEETNDKDLREQVTSLIKELKGNGQPGFISKIYERLNKLDNWRWYVMGISVALITILEVVIRLKR